VNGGWDNSITQEYVFGRCQDWMDLYLGKGHGVTFAVSETSPPVTNAPLASIWYASLMGEFMRNGVEILTPWGWQPGMWEVLHLYSRYNGSIAVRALSDSETTVSAYATIDPASGNLTMVLVNRALTASRTTTVALANTVLADGTYSTRQLANLPATETFISHTTNALVSGTVNVAGSQFTITLPALSITSVLLEGATNATPPPGASRLADVSVRAKSGTDADALIVGFVVGGTGSKDVLLRGIGPSLSPFGIGSPLADPEMSLTSQLGAPIAQNDNWGSSAAQIAPVATALGAFELDTSSLDAALLATLPAGGFTARIAGKAGGVGIALGEAYDALSGTARPLTSRLNVSPGDDSVIAGFVVSGGSSKTLLIRAVGPGLSGYNVPGVMSDPVLRVQAGRPRPLYLNDDWGSISTRADRIDRTTSVPSVPSDSKDSVLFLTPSPGIYTAVVTGANNTTGVALV
jgi:hypothetical protein